MSPGSIIPGATPLTFAVMIRLSPFTTIHGFADNHDAVCPTAAADTNHDGVIDINETEPMSGVTMVPFTSDPVSMQIVTNTYPTAGADVSYTYSKTVSLLGKIPAQVTIPIACGKLVEQGS